MSDYNEEPTIIRGYEIKSLLGKGGFGAVYKAYQAIVNRDIALKIILPRYASDPDFIKRFEYEARIIASLDYIHIIPLYDYWRDPDGAYLAMRYMRAGSVRQSLNNGAWQPPAVARLLDQLAHALTIAHQKGVIHRDIKPDNVLLDEEGNAYLTDFGIAKTLDNLIAESPTEAEGTFMGSPMYVSPEQITGQTITPQSDIYSLSMMVFELLTGNAPFAGQTVSDVLHHQLIDPPPPLKEFLPYLENVNEYDQIIQIGTAKDPDLRFRTPLEMADAFWQVVAQDKDSATAPRSHAKSNMNFTLRNPYKGLQPFTEADANDFFGRDELIANLIERLAENHMASRFLAVVGPSGSGKSSVVKAGLIPKLRQGILPNSAEWFIVQMTPGSQPISQLANSLRTVAVDDEATTVLTLEKKSTSLVKVVDDILASADAKEQVLLVIDQFEEVFTLLSDETERIGFLQMLHHAVTTPQSRLRVIITLRADFYDRPLMYEQFGQLMEQRTQVVLPMSAQEIALAVTQPAERVGLEVENALLGAIIEDVQEEPGALPLLQYALTELYLHREGTKLALAPYLEGGRVAGTLARRADKIFQGLTPTYQAIVHQIFLRLVTPGKDNQDTRRRLNYSELLAIAGNQADLDVVLDAFGKSRLLTFDRNPETREPTIEIAHEALIRQWGQLQTWIDESRNDIRLQRLLAQYAQEWHSANESKGFLLTESRLEQFVEWSKTTSLKLTPEEEGFLQASITEQKRLATLEQERQQRELALQKRAADRLRYLAGVLTLFLVVAGILTIFAFTQRQSAVEARDEAEANAVEAESFGLAAASQLALNSGDNDAAIVLALESVELQDSFQTRQALTEAAYQPGTRLLLTDHSAEVAGLAITSDGEQFVVGYSDGTWMIRTASTGEIVYQQAGYGQNLWQIALSPDDRFLLFSTNDGIIHLWDLESRTPGREFTYEQAALSLAFSPDGKTFASGHIDGKAFLWDIATGERLQELAGHSDNVRSLVFTSDGKTLITGSWDNRIILWDVATGEISTELLGHTNSVYSVVLSPDGRFLASGGLDQIIRLWDLETGLVNSLAGHTGLVQNIKFSPDGRYLVSTSEDTTVRVWDIATLQTVLALEGHQYTVRALAVFPDSKRLISGSNDGMLRVWDVMNGAIDQTYHFHRDDIRALEFGTNNQVLSSGFDRRIVLWDMTTGEILHEFKNGHSANVMSAQFSPNGQSILTTSADNTAILWDIATEQILRRFTGHKDLLTYGLFAPDGQSIFTASADRTLIHWDINTGEILQVYEGQANGIAKFDLSPDGSQLLSVTFNDDMLLWDVATGEILRTYVGHAGGARAVKFLPDGHHALSGGEDGQLILWNLDNGEIVRRYTGHTAPVLSLALSADGQWAVSGGRDQLVILWDVASGAIVSKFTGHTDGVWGLAINADASIVLSGGADTFVYRWRVDEVDEVVAWLQHNRYVAELSCSERQLYGAKCQPE